MNYLYLFLSVAFNVASYLVYKSIAQKQHDFSWSGNFYLWFDPRCYQCLFVHQSAPEYKFEHCLSNIFRRLPGFNDDFVSLYFWRKDKRP